MNNQKQTVELIFKGLEGVEVNYSLWHASRKLSANDLGIEDNKVAKGIIQLGQKKVFSPDIIKKMVNLKADVKHYLNEFSFKQGAWYFFNPEKTEEVLEALFRYKTRAMQLKAELLATYDQDCESFAQQCEREYPGFGDIIRQNLYPKDYVDQQISFDFELVSEVMKDPTVMTLKSISEQANEFLKSLEKKVSAKPEDRSFDRRSFGPLQSIADKASQLAFVNPCLNGVAMRINDFIKAIPKSGKLDDSILFELVREVEFFTDPSRVKNYCEKTRGIEVVIQPEQATTISPITSNDMSELFVGTSPELAPAPEVDLNSLFAEAI